MSSRLMQKIREEMGLAYSVYSYYTAYEGCGILAVSVATRPENCRKVIDEVMEEAERISRDGLAQWEMERAFGQFKSNSYLSMESSYNRMSRLGRSLLTLGKVTPVKERIDRMAKVSAEDVLALAQRLFRRDKWVVTVLGDVREDAIKGLVSEN